VSAGDADTYHGQGTNDTGGRTNDSRGGL
jgi:hypothetical protein